jgi:hypothetical protein
MAVIPVQISQPAVSPAFSAASSGGDEFANDGAPFLLITTIANRTLVIDSPHPDLPDLSISILAGSVISNRFDPLRWNDPATGRVRFSFSNHVGVNVAAVRTLVLGFSPGTSPTDPPPDLFA